MSGALPASDQAYPRANFLIRRYDQGDHDAVWDLHNRALCEAGALGYRIIKLDTTTVQHAAIALYTVNRLCREPLQASTRLRNDLLREADHLNEPSRKR